MSYRLVSPQEVLSLPPLSPNPRLATTMDSEPSPEVLRVVEAQRQREIREQQNCS